MKLSLVILTLVNAMVASTVKAASLVGHARTPEGHDDQASLEELARSIPDLLARVSERTNGRRLASSLDKLEVLIKNVDCHACMVR